MRYDKLGRRLSGKVSDPCPQMWASCIFHLKRWGRACNARLLRVNRTRLHFRDFVEQVLGCWRVREQSPVSELRGQTRIRRETLSPAGVQSNQRSCSETVIA